MTQFSRVVERQPVVREPLLGETVDSRAMFVRFLGNVFHATARLDSHAAGRAHRDVPHGALEGATALRRHGKRQVSRMVEAAGVELY